MNSPPHRKFKNISQEKREDIIRVLENGEMTRKDASKNFGVSYVSVAKMYSDFCKTGKVSKSKVGGNKPKKLSADMILFLKSLLVEDCTLTLKTLKERLFLEFSISVCATTISNYIESFNFSIKRLSKVSISAVTEKLIKERKDYSSWFLEAKNEGMNFIFFDETGFQVTMRKSHGRSEKGKKAVCITPGIKSRNKTVMACMWNQGLLHYKVLIKNGNRESYLEFLEEVFIILREKNIVNAIMIMDNVSFHKCAEIKNRVEVNGHIIKFLPPYSPFFNPIEYLFSQWKSIVRAERINNEVDLMTVIDDFKNILTITNCENYVRHVTTNIIKCLSGINVFEL